jgi:hypothetical protein
VPKVPEHCDSVQSSEPHDPRVVGVGDPAATWEPAFAPAKEGRSMSDSTKVLPVLRV